MRISTWSAAARSLPIPIYQQVIAESPDRADAWAGLLSALHATGHDQEAADQEKSMPAAVRAQLEKNVSYQQTMASVYKALGQSQAATALSHRAQQEDAAQHAAPAMDHRDPERVAALQQPAMTRACIAS